MISLDIKKGPDSRYRCVTDDQHLTLGRWLENDMGKNGGGLVEELFEDIGAFLSGRKDSVDSWSDLVRINIDRNGATVQAMPSRIGRPCVVTLDELVDSALRWFDVVNPDLSNNLRVIQSGWQHK